MTVLAADALVKTCSGCGQVLPADPDDEKNAGFYVRTRDENGRVLRWIPPCKRCRAAAKLRRMRRLGVRPRHEALGLVDAAPFIDWLRDVAARESFSVLATRLDVDESRIRSVVRGWQSHHGKRYPTKRVTVDLADRWLLLLDGPSIYELWPHLREE